METDMGEIRRKVKDFLDRRKKFVKRFEEISDENKRLKEENRLLRKKLKRKEK